MNDPIIFLYNVRTKRQKNSFLLLVYVLIFLLIGWSLARFYSLNVEFENFAVGHFFLLCSLLIASIKRPLLLLILAIKGMSFGVIFGAMFFSNTSNITLIFFLFLKNIIQLALLLQIANLLFHPFFDKKVAADRLCYYQYSIFSIGIYGFTDCVYAYLISLF